MSPPSCRTAPPRVTRLSIAFPAGNLATFAPAGVRVVDAVHPGAFGDVMEPGATVEHGQQHAVVLAVARHIASWHLELPLFGEPAGPFDTVGAGHVGDRDEPAPLPEPAFLFGAERHTERAHHPPVDRGGGDVRADEPGVDQVGGGGLQRVQADAEVVGQEVVVGVEERYPVGAYAAQGPVAGGSGAGPGMVVLDDDGVRGLLL